MKLLLILYIIFLSFTNAFAISGTLTIDIIILFLMFILYLFNVFLGKYKIYLCMADKILFIFLLEIIFSYFINTFILGFNTKIFHHLLSYVVTILLMYFILKQIMLNIVGRNFSINRILKYVLYAVLIAALFGILDVFMKVFFHFDVNQYIYRPAVSTMNIKVYNFYRERSFVVEPGHFALFLEILGPLAVYYIINELKNFFIKLILVFIIMFSFLLTFSTGGILIFLISSLFVIIYYVLQKGIRFKKNYILFIMVFFFLLVLFILYGVTYIDFLIKYFEMKITNSGSASNRLEKIEYAIFLFNHGDVFRELFGYGPGGYLVLYSHISIICLYLLLLIETGIVGLVLFVLFQILILVNIFKIKTKLKYYLLVAYISSSIHYMLISNYWYPWYWFLIAFICLLNIRKYNEKKE